MSVVVVILCILIVHGVDKSFADVANDFKFSSKKDLSLDLSFSSSKSVFRIENFFVKSCFFEKSCQDWQNSSSKPSVLNSCES